MLKFFETRIDPYPAGQPPTPPHDLFAFLWSCTQGMRGYIAAMTVCTALIGVFEAMLFAMLGDIVDWLGKTEPARLWAQEGDTLLLLAGILIASPLVIALQTLIKHQALAGALAGKWIDVLVTDVNTANYLMAAPRGTDTTPKGTA